MKDQMMRPSDWPNMKPDDPVKQLFDRVFEGPSRRSVSIVSPSADTRQWIPHVDIKEEAHRFILYVDAPGVAPSAIEAYMDHGVLTIKGERKTESQDCRDSFLRIERACGAFHRRFNLPASADPHRITVTAHEGILYIIVHKRPKQSARDIRIAKSDVGHLARGMPPFNARWRPA